MTEKTVRGMLADIQRELLETADLPPGRAQELLNATTALLYNCNEDVRKAEMAYRVVYRALFKALEKAAHAKIEAECSPEYEKYREAQDMHKLAEQMIITLRGAVRLHTEQMRMGG